VAGRDAYIIALGIPVTMSNSAPVINGPADVWIDKETFFMLKTVTRSQESDEVVSSMEVAAIRYNPSLDDALFTFTPPLGVTVSDQRETPTP
jgi:outer membrane lipoprotein-sorting protein